VASSPFSLAGKKAAFGGIRSGTARTSFDDDDDDDDINDGRQKVELQEGSISLEQVSCRPSTFNSEQRLKSCSGTTDCLAKRLEERTCIKTEYHHVQGGAYDSWKRFVGKDANAGLQLN
jgi:hypothetical protein